jgi:hypothetical protein
MSNNLYIKARSGSNFEAEYQVILNYAASNVYLLPSAAQQVKQNLLLKNLKLSGAWAKLDTFVCLATDGGSNFALIDWKKLTQYTAVNSPIFTTNQGFQGNGTSSYLETNFNPSSQGVKYTLNNASRYAYVSVANVNNVIDGISNAARNRMILANNNQHNINSGTTFLNSSFEYLGVGMKSIHRTSSTNVTLFNGTVSGLRTANSTIIENASQFILRSGTAYSTNRIAMYAMGASLISENTDFVNSFNTYINSL